MTNSRYSHYIAYLLSGIASVVFVAACAKKVEPVAPGAPTISEREAKQMASRLERDGINGIFVDDAATAKFPDRTRAHCTRRCIASALIQLRPMRSVEEVCKKNALVGPTPTEQRTCIAQVNAEFDRNCNNLCNTTKESFGLPQ